MCINILKSLYDFFFLFIFDIVKYIFCMHVTKQSLNNLSFLLLYM